MATVHSLRCVAHPPFLPSSRLAWALGAAPFVICFACVHVRAHFEQPCNQTVSLHASACPRRVVLCPWQ
jgi:hypothetical protein